jgi:ABC-2 type transport system ATP-binding protein
LLCGILTPTAGSCSIFGNVSGTVQANRKLGLVFGTRSQLWMHLTIYQSLNISAEIYGITGKEKVRRISELAELFEINELLDQRARTLSLGQRMRCELVTALIHYPAILLADEPTVGLDVVAKNQFREIMNRWREEKNTTLLLTSHDCSDVEMLCNRSILVDQGKIKYDGSLNGLKGDLAYIRRIIVRLSERHSTIQWNDEKISTKSIDEYSLSFEVNTSNTSMVEAIRKIFVSFEAYILDIKIHEVTLEEVVNRLFISGKTHG